MTTRYTQKIADDGVEMGAGHVVMHAEFGAVELLLPFDEADNSIVLDACAEYIFLDKHLCSPFPNPIKLAAWAMSKFKVDDRVELVNLDAKGDDKYSPCDSNTIGNTGIATDVSDSGTAPICVDWDNGSCNHYNEHNLKLIEETKVKTTLEQQAAYLRVEIDKLDVLIADKAKADMGSGRAYDPFDIRYTITCGGVVTSTIDSSCIKTGRAFKTREAAERFVRYEQLCQELRLAQIESYGDSRPDWLADSELKWCVIIRNGRVVVAQYAMHYNPMHFKLEKEAYAFKNSYSIEALTLLERGIGF